jgi:GLTT repeat (6 copies)
VLTPFAFGYRGRGWHAATLTDLATGGGLAVICVVTLLAWTAAWRRTLRADGVLSRPERGAVRVRHRRGRGAGGQAGAADPEQVLTALRALLAPMLDTPAEPALAQPGLAEPGLAEPGPAEPGLAEPGLAEPGLAVGAAAAVIPGPRSAPEAGRVPRDCRAEPAEPAGTSTEAGTTLTGPPGRRAGGPQVMPAGPEGIAVIESMLAGAELLMTGCDEEEAW